MGIFPFYIPERPSAHNFRDLLKAEFQLGLFGGETEVRERKKRNAEQLSLIPLQNFLNVDRPKAKPQSGGGRHRAPKGGGYYVDASGNLTHFPGGRFIPAGFTAATTDQVNQQQKSMGAVVLPRKRKTAPVSAPTLSLFDAPESPPVAPLPAEPAAIDPYQVEAFQLTSKGKNGVDRYRVQFADGKKFLVAARNGDEAMSEAIATRKKQRKAALMGNAVYKDFYRDQSIAFIGRKITSDDDLAAVGTIMRNPRFEKFHYFFVKGDTCVGTVSVGARIPSTSPIMPMQDGEEGIEWLKNQMQRCGADGYYMMHNHPSGEPDPSGPDKELTKQISKLVPGFRGHVVMNHMTYGVVNADGSSVVRAIDRPVAPSKAPLKASPILGQKFRDPEGLLELGKQIERPTGYVTLISRTKNDIRGVMLVPELQFMANPQKIAYGFGRQTGSGHVFLVGGSDDEGSKLRYKAMIQANYIQDAMIGDEGRSLRTSTGVKPLADDDFGLDNFDRVKTTENHPQVGQSITIDGHTYQLNANHRWERVDLDTEAELLAPPSTENEIASKLPWAITKEEFARHPKATVVPRNSLLAIALPDLTEESFEGRKTSEIDALLIVLNAKRSGNKEDKIQRILKTAKYRVLLSTATLDSLQALPGKELNGILKDLGLYVGSTKYAKAAKLISWREEARKEEARALVGTLHRIHVKGALIKGKDVPDRVVTQYPDLIDELRLEMPLVFPPADSVELAQDEEFIRNAFRRHIGHANPVSGDFLKGMATMDNNTTHQRFVSALHRLQQKGEVTFTTGYSYPANKDPAIPESEGTAIAIPVPPEDNGPDLEPNADYITVRGKKSRERANAAARELLERKQKDFTTEELRMLAAYTGRGGIKDDKATTSEYFTLPEVGEFMKAKLQQYGFTKGLLLEPSCGSGAVLRAGGGDGIKAVGVELDETASKVAQALNPDADVFNVPFERYCLNNPDPQFDAAIGNIPFGVPLPTSDMAANAYKRKEWGTCEEIFMDGIMDQLLPEGVMAMVVPHGVVSGAKFQKLRDTLTRKGRVLASYRLPETAFQHAGTQAVTDILIMQKHPQAVMNSIMLGDTDVLAAVADPDFVAGSYYERNPDHIAGEVGTRRRGDRELMTVKGKISPQILNALPEASPVVDYESIQPLAMGQGPKIGDVRYINGVAYQLNENSRWERVASEDRTLEQLYAEANASAFGVESLAEAEAALKDPVARCLINPDHLGAYLEMSRSVLHPKDQKLLQDAAIAAAAGKNDDERKKIAHAILLGGHLRLLQEGNPDQVELEQALAMLQRFREQYGNPNGDRALTKLAMQFPSVLPLQGAFNREGEISDYFANPEKLKTELKTTFTDVMDAVKEAWRTNQRGLSLDDIQGSYEGELSAGELQSALFADPNVGYWGGVFYPLNQLLVGNGYELADQFLDRISQLSPGDTEREKLLQMVGEIRRRLEPRALEDITMRLWAVGRWLSVDAVNAYFQQRGLHGVILNDDGSIEPGQYVEANKQDYGLYGMEEDLFKYMNQERINRGSKTPEAKRAIAAFEEEFAAWLATSEYRAEVETAYNAVYTAQLTPEYSEESLNIAKLNPIHSSMALHGYQNSTVRQMLDVGKGVIGLNVGLGKTATGIALALALKEQGKANKPCIPVPKSVLSNWVAEIGRWAPDANVMVVGQSQMFFADGSPMWEIPGMTLQTTGRKRGQKMPDTDDQGRWHFVDAKGNDHYLSLDAVHDRGRLSFEDDDQATKQKKLQMVAQNDYDIVLMSEPVFESIPLDPEREYGYMEELANNHINMDLKRNQDKWYKLQQQKQAKINALAQRRGDKKEVLTWEDLGIDALLKDEAHHEKNLFAAARQQDTAFLATPESDRALNLFYKAKYTREIANNQNVYLMTASPTVNSPLEIYSMFMHTCPEEMDRRGIRNVDDFIEMFGDIYEDEVPMTDGSVKSKNALWGLKSLKDLRRVINRFAVVKDAADVKLPIPEEVEVKHDVELTPQQQSIYGSLRERAKALIDGMNDEDDPDHIFSIISDMDKAAVSLEYYNETGSRKSVRADLSEEGAARSPKIDECVRQVMQSRAAHGGKQIIFSEPLVLHGRLKDALVAAGYPEDEIMIVNASTAKSSDKRQAISEAYNSGRYSLVIGNQTMSEGMNFNIGTTDIHEIDIPWTPEARKQRRGRGVRQGNKLDEVRCHTYHAKGSFDENRNFTVNRKKNWQNETWKGTEDRVKNQNTGLMSLDEIRINLADDPDAERRRIENDRELQMQKQRSERKKAALQQFSRLQNLRSAFAQLPEASRGSFKGQDMENQIMSLRGSLNKDPYFDHKDILDHPEPVHICPDGQIVKTGAYLQVPDNEHRYGKGGILEVVKVEPGLKRVEVRPVLGKSGPYDDPTNFTQGKTYHAPLDMLGGEGNSKLKPTVFNDGIRDEILLKAVKGYNDLHGLGHEAINANRDRIVQAIRNSGRDTPYFDKDGIVQITTGRNVPQDAEIMFPTHPGALDLLLQGYVRASLSGRRGGSSEYDYLELMERITGRSWYRNQDGNPSIQTEYKERLESLRQVEVAKFNAATEAVPEPTATPAPATPAPATPAPTQDWSFPHPWEMTETEWRAAKDQAKDLEKGNYRQGTPRWDALDHLAYGMGDRSSTSPDWHNARVNSRKTEFQPIRHKAIIEKAVRDGRDVPDHIQKHYQLGRYALTLENSKLDLEAAYPYLQFDHEVDRGHYSETVRIKAIDKETGRTIHSANSNSGGWSAFREFGNILRSRGLMPGEARPDIKPAAFNSTEGYRMLQESREGSAFKTLYDKTAPSHESLQGMTPQQAREAFPQVFDAHFHDLVDTHEDWYLRHVNAEHRMNLLQNRLFEAIYGDSLNKAADQLSLFGGDWEESRHPRGDGGKFTSKGDGESPKKASAAQKTKAPTGDTEKFAKRLVNGFADYKLDASDHWTPEQAKDEGYDANHPAMAFDDDFHSDLMDAYRRSPDGFGDSLRSKLLNEYKTDFAHETLIHGMTKQAILNSDLEGIQKLVQQKLSGAATPASDLDPVSAKIAGEVSDQIDDIRSEILDIPASERNQDNEDFLEYQGRLDRIQTAIDKGDFPKWVKKFFLSGSDSGLDTDMIAELADLEMQKMDWKHIGNHTAKAFQLRETHEYEQKTGRQGARLVPDGESPRHMRQLAEAMGANSRYVTDKEYRDGVRKGYAEHGFSQGWNAASMERYTGDPHTREWYYKFLKQKGIDNPVWWSK